MQRLKTRAQFQAVLAAGTAARTAHFALHRKPEPQLLVGAVIPKRWAKRAVTRNTIKRQIYSVTAESKLPASAYIVRLRTGFAGFRSATSDALRKAVRAELLELLSQVGA